jgi:hypothetical protein
VRLVGAVLCEQHDEGQLSKRYFSAGSIAKLERKEQAMVEHPELMADLEGADGTARSNLHT